MQEDNCEELYVILKRGFHAQRTLAEYLLDMCAESVINTIILDGIHIRVTAERVSGDVDAHTT
jgi:hypothetical protein